MEAVDILVRRGLLNERQLAEVRAAQNNGSRLEQVAVQLGYCTEEAVLKALATEVGLDYVDLTEAQVDLSLLKDFPPKMLHRQALFPVRRENGSLVVATSDPFDLYPLDELSASTGLTVIPVLASRTEIAKLIKQHLGVGSETVTSLMAQAEENVQLLSEIETDGSELSEMAQEASVIRLVNEILLEAIETRASDVHIEPQGAGLRIRYRIDGLLHPQPVPPEITRFQSAILSRLKIMSRLNIAEKRLPQDGRIKLLVRGREVDVRVSVIPMIHGEGIVMRILDKGSMEFKLQKLGMEEDMYKTFHQLITMPHGIVLVTGPTGSGKTTTLYSALLEIRNDSTKIITTEDPVEYQLDGINQIQVHAKIGLTFGASLRSILRHDPDIVLIGEIRDLETAENAIQASLTGHLVFSTLHTNDAAGAYTRLGRYGGRAVPCGQHRGRRNGSAPRASAVYELQGKLCAQRRRVAPRLSQRQTEGNGRQVVPVRRLPNLPQCWLYRPNGNLRIAANDEQNPATRPRSGQHVGYYRGRGGRGNDHFARRWLAKSALRPHHGR